MLNVIVQATLSNVKRKRPAPGSASTADEDQACRYRPQIVGDACHDMDLGQNYERAKVVRVHDRQGCRLAKQLPGIRILALGPISDTTKGTFKERRKNNLQLFGDGPGIHE